MKKAKKPRNAALLSVQMQRTLGRGVHRKPRLCGMQQKGLPSLQKMPNSQDAKTQCHLIQFRQERVQFPSNARF
jgi:hypothetical protein